MTTRRINLEGIGRKQLWVVTIYHGGILWAGLGENRENP